MIESSKNTLLLFQLVFTGLTGTFLLYLLKKNKNLALLHLLSFWFLTAFYQSLTLYRTDLIYIPKYYYLTCMMIAVYILLFSYFSRTIGSVNLDEYCNANINLHSKHINYIITAFILIKLLSLQRYGLYGFNLQAFRSILGAGRIETAVNTLVVYPYLGAVFSYIGLLCINFKKFFNHITTILMLLSASLYLFGPNGGRRFIIYLGIISLFFFFSKSDFSILNKHNLFFLIIILCAVLTLSTWYQKVRQNFPLETKQLELIEESARNELTIDSKKRDFKGILKQYYSYNENAVPLRENLSKRFSPFYLLYVLGAKQWEGFVTVKGSVFLQTLVNTTPDIGFIDKHYSSSDLILADFLGVETNDLPSSVLASVQSEIWFFAYIFTPLLYAGIIVLIFRLFKIPHLNIVVRYSLLGILFKYMMEFETSMDSFILNVRDVGIIFVIVGAGGMVFRVTVEHINRMFFNQNQL